MKTALIVIDFINEIVHKDGKLAGKGYSNYIQEYDVFEKLNSAISKAREQEMMILFVGLCFEHDYSNQPKTSPLFGKAHEYNILQVGTWGTKFHEDIKMKETDTIIHKHRVSAFFETSLDTLLQENKIDSLLIAGVATDLAVSNTVRDAHERDYIVTILEDCCAAANREDHDFALHSLQKIASVQKSPDFFKI